MNIQTIRVIAARLVHDRRGAAITEYVIIVALIAMVALGVYRTLGTNIQTKVNQQATSIGNL